MAILEPQCFDFTKYKKHSELDKDIDDKVTNEDFMEGLSDRIVDVKNIQNGNIYLYISYDTELCFLTVEKCLFLGYLSSSFGSDDFKLQLQSMDSKQIINVPSDDYIYTLYGKGMEDEIKNHIKSRFASFLKAKTKIYNRIQAIEHLIVETNALYEEIVSDPCPVPYSENSEDITGEADLLGGTIRKYQDALISFYKENHLFFMDGKKNSSLFTRHVNSLLKTQSEDAEEDEEEDEENVSTVRRMDDVDDLESQKDLF